MRAVILANSRAKFNSRLLVNRLILVTRWSITLLVGRVLRHPSGKCRRRQNLLWCTLCMTLQAAVPPSVPTIYRSRVAVLTTMVVDSNSCIMLGTLMVFMLSTPLTVRFSKTGAHSASVIAIVVNRADSNS